MTHGALFNGIGGFQLAADWMGWENVMHCEIDDFCNKVVKKHFPNSIQHGDIKTTDFRIYRGRIDILTGGFPCQPYSTAGKRKGNEDDRHLWPEMLRAIREISPHWVVGENVRGLTNWNGGMVFDQVQADLETEGYEVLPFLLPACSVDAPHRRDRIWIIAHTKGCFGDLSIGPKERKEEMDAYGNGTKRIVTNTHGNDYGGEDRPDQNRCEAGQNKSKGYQRQRFRDGLNGNDEKGLIAHTTQLTEREQADKTFALSEGREAWVESGSSSSGWNEFPTQSPVCGGDDGVPDWMDRLKSLGNAIVPQVALQIFKAIEQYESL